MNNSPSIQLADFVRDVTDFPKPGIIFKDITPLLSDPTALRASIDELEKLVGDRPVDCVVGVEARGFIFGAPLAVRLGVGFVPVRKPGKLPYQTASHEYELEYGTDTLEIHVDAVGEGTRVLVVDDLLATGGTVQACCQLIVDQGASVVACTFLIDLAFLDGARRLAPHPVLSVLKYEA